jgi:hypothetical protein
MAAAIAAMASILFRMVNSSGSFRCVFFTRTGIHFARKRSYGTRAPALAATQSKANASRAASFPQKCDLFSGNFGQFSRPMIRRWNSL